MSVPEAEKTVTQHVFRRYRERNLVCISVILKLLVTFLETGRNVSVSVHFHVTHTITLAFRSWSINLCYGRNERLQRRGA